MAAPRNAATPDRQGRMLLAAVVVAALAVFVWLVVGLVDSAFG
jgi:hypothetical protein